MTDLTAAAASSTFAACEDNALDIFGGDVYDEAVQAEALSQFKGIAAERGWDVDEAVALLDR